MTQPLRVLHVVRPAEGGLRQHVLQLLEQSEAMGVTPSVAAPPTLLDSLAHNQDWQASIPLDIAPGFSLARDLLAASRLARIAPQFADIIHAHGLRAAWIAALAHRRRPMPFVFTAHNLPGGSPLARLGLPFVGNRASQIIAVSQAVADSLVLHALPRAKITVVPNGVDFDWFAPEHLDRAGARQAFGLPKDAFVVAAIARLSPEKGLDTLLETAGQRPGMNFLIAGEGPQRPQLERNLPPNARLLGRIDDIRPLLAAANVLAVPSRQEGQGIVALEAMAARVPIVATRVGGLAQMLSDGETALLVPAGDSMALAAALSRLQSDKTLPARLVENAAIVVREQYDIGQMARATAAIYEKMRGTDGT